MTRRRKLVAVAAAVLLLAGAATGVALARGQARVTAPRLVQGKSLLAASAAYLGIPLRTLKSEVGPSRSLASIARATPGRTVAGLRAALFHDAAYTLDNTHMVVGGAKLRYISGWLRRHIAAYVAGQCPLHLSALFIRLGGTCNGMMPA